MFIWLSMDIPFEIYRVGIKKVGIWNSQGLCACSGNKNPVIYILVSFKRWCHHLSFFVIWSGFYIWVIKKRKISILSNNNKLRKSRTLKITQYKVWTRDGVIGPIFQMNLVLKYLLVLFSPPVQIFVFQNFTHCRLFIPI